MNKCRALQYIPVNLYCTGTRLISKNTIHHPIIIGLEIAATFLWFLETSLPVPASIQVCWTRRLIELVINCTRGDNYSSIFSTWEFIFIVLYRTSKNLRMISIVGIPYNVKMIISKCTSRALINQFFFESYKSPLGSLPPT